MLQLLTAASRLSDPDLLAEVKIAAARECDATVRLVALLAQLDERRLYLGEGCSSLFTYCTQVLHLSEHAAYGRIEAARAARRFPVILELLGDGSVTLTTVTLLAPHLTPANHCEVLDAARHKSKRGVEHMVACLRPQPAVPATIRQLPEARPASALHRPPVVEPTGHDDSSLILAPPPARRPATVTPLAPERYKVQFTISQETHDKLRRVQDLLRHSIRNGDPAAIFDRALTLLLADLEQAKLAATDRPRTARLALSGSRHIPASVRREVWKRDGGQCAFVGTQGRCTERRFLEFHHVQPYAVGGAAVVENLELRCRAHNMYEAEKYFGNRLPLFVREADGPSFLSTRSGPRIRGFNPQPVRARQPPHRVNIRAPKRIEDSRGVESVSWVWPAMDDRRSTRDRGQRLIRLAQNRHSGLNVDPHMTASATQLFSAPGHRLGRGAAALVLGCVLLGYLMSLRNGMWPPSHPWSGMTLVGLALLNLGLPSGVAGCGGLHESSYTF